jgi:hypothetical protein
LQAMRAFFFHLSTSASCRFGLYSITSPQNLDAIALGFPRISPLARLSVIGWPILPSSRSMPAIAPTVALLSPLRQRACKE